MTKTGLDANFLFSGSHAMYGPMSHYFANLARVICSWPWCAGEPTTHSGLHRPL